jgi:hypothetical protein
MSISFSQLLELLGDPGSPVDQIRYCAMTSDIIHLVVYVSRPEQGFGESFLTKEQFEQLKQQFPEIKLRVTGTFPLPPK